MMATTTTTTNVADVIAKLKARLDALGDGRDCRSENERAAYRSNYDSTQHIISALANDPDDLDKLLRRVADLEGRRTMVLEKAASIDQELASAPDWRIFADGRDRDRQFEHLAMLRRQLQMLHEGTLLAGPSVTYERVADLDQQISELSTKIAQLRARIDGYLQQAEALLGEPVEGA